MRCVSVSLSLVLAMFGCSSSDGSTTAEQSAGDSDAGIVSDVGGASSSDISPAATSKDTQNSVQPPSRPQTQLLPPSCFVGASNCDPRSGEGCSAGEACDFSSQGELVCFPPPNEAAIGQSCSNQGGPYCASGGWCVSDTSGGPGTCRKVCCVNQECSEPGFECVGMLNNPSMGSIGVCRTPPDPTDSPQCLPYGAPCTPSNDECCGQCHFDHCH